MRYHIPAPSSAYMVTFLCFILQTTRPTTLQQKEDLMHTPSKIKVSAYTHRVYLTWWWSADQLFLITENSCSGVSNMQETTVRPPREAHGAESGITYKHMYELKPVYGQQLIHYMSDSVIQICWSCAKTCTLLMQMNHLNIYQLAPNIRDWCRDECSRI